MPRRWDGAPVHCAALPEAPGAVDWEPRPGVPRGTVSEHEVPSDQLDGDRRVWLYQPPGDVRESEPVPVLVLLDGEHWQPRLGVAHLLDNLPAARRLRATLTTAGYDDAVYREFNGSHDYLCWRTELADGLVGLLSPDRATAGSARATA